MRWRRTEASDTDVAFSMRRSAAEDIAEVLFEGFADEEDEAIQTAYTSALASGGIPYQRLNTADIRS